MTLNGSSHLVDAGHLDDNRVRGFTASGDVPPLRYSGTTFEATESTGMALSLVPQGARILDVGCGTGDLARALRDRCHCEVVGIEPHAERAEFCRTQGLTVHSGYFTPELVRSLGRFDVVMFMDVLEHVADPVELLDLARSVLNPNGHVIISVPNVAHWTVRVKLMAGRFDYRPTGIMDATHLRWFTAKTIGSVLSAAGFEVVHRDVSRGVWLEIYSRRLPWRWLKKQQRVRLLNWLCRRWPTVFGCQHVVKAAMRPMANASATP